jgi:hypothetical protein
MNEAMLLCQRRRYGQAYLHQAGLDTAELRAQRRHELLALEAGPDPIFEFRELGNE